jgi:hypothetical protein
MNNSDRKFPPVGVSISILAVSALLASAVLVACSSTEGSLAQGTSTVNVMLSDPATCAAPNGPFSHVWVTITDVQANISSSAGANGSGWTDLTPGLSSAPKQIDLLGQANNQCFLASLGDNKELQAGSYQQIRLLLAASAPSSLTNNPCGAAANCVVLTSDSSVHTLQLASEDQTGVKIPSGQIASGSFTISAGQTKDLNIDFNTCESIVNEGNGNYLFKPVLHAGEVSTTSSSINGTVLDASTGKAVSGNVFVSLEQPDGGGIDRVIMSTQAGPDGSFVFCPLPPGTYDVVIVGSRSSDSALYMPTIVTGVQTGSTTGNVQLNPPPPAQATVSSANLTGQVTSAGDSGAIAAVISLSVLETVNSKVYTIPQQPSTSPYFNSTQTVTTAASTGTITCPSGTDCFDYSLPVASGDAYIGAWSATGTMLAPASTTTSLASYSVDGQSTTCTTTNASTSPATTLSGPGAFTSVAVTQVLSFTGCQ